MLASNQFQNCEHIISYQTKLQIAFDLQWFSWFVAASLGLLPKNTPPLHIRQRSAWPSTSEPKQPKQSYENAKTLIAIVPARQSVQMRRPCPHKRAKAWCCPAESPQAGQTRAHRLDMRRCSINVNVMYFHQLQQINSVRIKTCWSVGIVFVSVEQECASFQAVDM